MSRLCIAPRYCTRASFFVKVPILLEAAPDITGLHVISDAYVASEKRDREMEIYWSLDLFMCGGCCCRFVPVIKMKVDGISVDLLFVSLDLESIPEDIDMLDDQYLKGLDEASVRSCNGVRVTERILQLVPNLDTFRTTLIAVKHWARVRCRSQRGSSFFCVRE